LLIFSDVKRCRRKKINTKEMQEVCFKKAHRKITLSGLAFQKGKTAGVGLEG